ncbi:MAG: TIGR02757 family protein [Desulfobacteraceae bacterium]|jgi:uncharacterized protein (TIGR02757 family)|nr:TIGR02757 family protein [Desulfobacteraceae bacterium]
MKKKLDHLYTQYNQRQYVHPDPLEYLYHYDDIKDREIVGLIASSLAYGKVAQILKSVSNVLNIMGDSPFEYLSSTSESEISHHFHLFVHRFAKGGHLSALLIGIKHAIAEYESIYNCFMSGFKISDDTIVPALSVFSKNIIGTWDECRPGHLMPCPDKGSACKRLNLFLRWMVRCDDVDPGGWHGIPASKLIIPLDTHMFQIAAQLGLTIRKQANLKTAIEITNGYKRWAPDDPVRYDFALTRFGIRNDLAGNNALFLKLGV